MKIEKLNKTEQKKVTKFQNAWIRIVRSAVKKRGISDKTSELLFRDAKILGKAIVKSGVDLGVQWLESQKPKK